MKIKRELIEEITKEVLAVLREMYLHQSFKEIEKVIGLKNTSESKFSRLINHTDEVWHSFNREDFDRAHKYIEDNNLWGNRNYYREIKNTPDSLYHSLLAFYNVRYGSERDTVESLQGIWRIYRPSVTIPDKYVIGMAVIKFNDRSKALIVKEYYRGKDDASDSRRKIKMRSRYQEWFGYLCRKKQKYFIISRDKAVTSAQMTYLPHPSREPVPDTDETTIVTMSGTIIGVYANHVFTSRVYYERFDGNKEELMEMIDIYPKEQIPEIVCAELDNKQRDPGVPFDFF